MNQSKPQSSTTKTENQPFREFATTLIKLNQQNNLATLVAMCALFFGFALALTVPIAVIVLDNNHSQHLPPNPEIPRKLTS